jgi:Flp pilus assembly protein TadD
VHVLGIALTQIAQMAVTDGDHATAVAAASEALEHQERIGYAEGTVAALHVLGAAYHLAGRPDDARQAHRRALTLATRIGHVAAMCEAMEDLARVEALTDAGLARTLVLAARSERAARGVPLRPRDAVVLDLLSVDVADDGSRAAVRPFAALLAELTL